MSDRAKGILCLVASAFGFALMAFFVRLCDDFGEAVPTLQKSFFRNAIAFAIALAVWLRRHRFAAPVRLSGLSGAKVWTTLVLRSAFGTLGILLNFYALGRMPIAEAMTLNKLAPFFTVFLSWIFLGERLRLRQAVSLLLAFGGATLVMRPGLEGDFVSALAAVGGGFCAGSAYACVRQLGRLKVEGALVVLFFSAFSCLVVLPFIAVGFQPMSSVQTVILLGAGVGAAIGQFGVTAAYRFAEPRSIAVFDYTNIIFTALLGFLFLGQVPDLVAALGFAVILLAACRMRA